MNIWFNLFRSTVHRQYIHKLFCHYLMTEKVGVFKTELQNGTFGNRDLTFFILKRPSVKCTAAQIEQFMAVNI